VRTIYRRYLALGSFTALLDDLRAQGIVTKVSTLGDGRRRGGIPFARGALAYFLRNRVYIGELKHKTKSYPGEHEAILDKDLFDAVQAMRAAHCHEHYRTRESPPALLRGLIVASDGVPYKPIGSKRGAARSFRYKRSPEPGAPIAKGLPSSLAGAAFDAHVTGLFYRESANATDRSRIHHTDDDTVCRFVAQITIIGKQARITLTPEGQARRGIDSVTLDLTPFIHTRRRRDVIGVNRMSRPIRAETRATLLETIARARLWLDELASGRVASIDVLANREGHTPRQVTATLSCAFLAPDIVAAAIDGTLPDRIGAARVRDLPPEWTRQRQTLGLR
jgi:site-specific DNA recombinase